MMCVNASVPVLPAQLDFVHISSVLKNRPFFGQPEGVFRAVIQTRMHSGVGTDRS